MESPLTEAEMYRAAADLLRRDGWCREHYREPGGKKHCMLGALADANSLQLDDAMLLADRGTLRTVTDGVEEFNDDHCVTINDAIAALEIAADLAS